MAENEALLESRENDIDLGTVKIADDVVAMIAAYATLEVEGVKTIGNPGGTALLGKASYRKPIKGVRVEVADGSVAVDLSVILRYGYNVPTTSSKVQARVKQAIENMTGLAVDDINVRISGVDIDNEEDK